MYTPYQVELQKHDRQGEWTLWKGAYGGTGETWRSFRTGTKVKESCRPKFNTRSIVGKVKIRDRGKKGYGKY